MDGVFVAYHNTDEIFGFQYIPIEEMDKRLFGHSAGHRIFNKCIGLLDAIYAEITTYFPEQTVHCTWETVDMGRVMHVWIEPKTWYSQPAPVVQLDVKVKHYLAGESVHGHQATASVKRPCMSTGNVVLPALSDRIRP